MAIVVNGRQCGVFDMTNFVRNFVRDESGAAAAEYALILAIVGAGIAGAAFALGGAIKTSIGKATSCIDTVGGTTASTVC